MPRLNTLSMFSFNRAGGAPFIPADPGEVVFTTVGNHDWVVPEGVASISVVAVGGGGGGGSTGGSGGAGGGGGGLGYKNDIVVTPGSTITVNVGAGGLEDSLTHGGDSYVIDTSTVCGFGGYSSNSATGITAGGIYTGTGGGNGGRPDSSGISDSTGGGGAGGYSGNGGGSSINAGGQAGTGGAGGGGAAGGSSDAASGGGGVGLYGEGTSGTGGTYTAGDASVGGGGGSGGTAGGAGATTNYGGSYGGGGAGAELNSESGDGGQGAVRILWGDGRAFPTTLVAEIDSDTVTTI